MKLDYLAVVIFLIATGWLQPAHAAKMEHVRRVLARENCPTNQVCDLSGADLSQADLRGIVLRNANLTRANLTNATLSNADLRGANFTGATLSGTAMNGAICDDNTRGLPENILRVCRAVAAPKNSLLRT